MAIKDNFKIVFQDENIRVMQRVHPYIEFFVYCYKRLLPQDHPNRDTHRFGKVYFNQQLAQKDFASILNTTNLVKLPTIF